MNSSLSLVNLALESPDELEVCAMAALEIRTQTATGKSCIVPRFSQDAEKFSLEGSMPMDRQQQAIPICDMAIFRHLRIAGETRYCASSSKTSSGPSQLLQDLYNNVTCPVFLNLPC